MRSDILRSEGVQLDFHNRLTIFSNCQNLQSELIITVKDNVRIQ